MYFQDNKRLLESLSKIRVRCNCSHTIYMPPYGPDYIVCNYCGRKVYKNEKVKFKDILTKKLKEV